MLLLVWILPAIVSLMCGMCWSTPGELGEYCMSESFRARCPSDHVIIMTTATFGKMHNGRCARASHGAIGCSSDVIYALDRYCSGSNSCEMPIPNNYLKRATECPADLGNFLLAEYRCVEIVNNRTYRCKPLTLKQKTGTIASVVTSTTACGAPGVPWVIEGRPGQGINVSILVFSHALQIPNDRCYAWAQLEEMDGRIMDLCFSQLRSREERHIYTTDSHQLMVVIYMSGPLFLLKYTVFGCPDIDPTEDMWVERDGDNVTCGSKTSNLQWTLYCHNDSWIGKTFSCSSPVCAPCECPPGPTALMAAVIGVLLFFVVVLATVAIVLLIRNRRISAILNTVTSQVVEFNRLQESTT